MLDELSSYDAGTLLNVDAADGDPAAFLLLTVRTIREPVVQYGPFVMNTRKKIEQAINDYQNGPERTQARLFKTACLEL